MKTDTRIINHGHPLYMGMFSDEGNILVADVVNSLIRHAIRGHFQRPALRSEIDLRLKEIEAFHGEVYDTEVRMAVARRLNAELCVPMGWVQIDYFFDDMN